MPAFNPSFAIASIAEITPLTGEYIPMFKARLNGGGLRSHHGGHARAIARITES